MPKPVYIISAHLVVESKETGLLTIANVVEKFTAIRFEAPKNVPEGQVAVITFQPWRTMAVWKRRPDEKPENEFEFEWVVIFPNGQRMPPNPIQKAVFGPQPLFRVAANFMNPMPFDQSGVLQVISRARCVGSTEWDEQICEIDVEIQPTPTDANQQSPPSV